jgi:hypothetical protein
MHAQRGPREKSIQLLTCASTESRIRAFELQVVGPRGHSLSESYQLPSIHNPYAFTKGVFIVPALCQRQLMSFKVMTTTNL